ncbi:MAG TPA: hypothetical protein VMD74_01050 [Candidatus Methylomirabilis sp.]|nr:hypothetical protein [Candidatus Methylomirabilis sp.]
MGFSLTSSAFAKPIKLFIKAFRPGEGKIVNDESYKLTRKGKNQIVRSLEKINGAIPDGFFCSNHGFAYETMVFAHKIYNDAKDDDTRLENVLNRSPICCVDQKVVLLEKFLPKDKWYAAYEKAYAEVSKRVGRQNVRIADLLKINQELGKDLSSNFKDVVMEIFLYLAEREPKDSYVALLSSPSRVLEFATADMDFNNFAWEKIPLDAQEMPILKQAGLIEFTVIIRGPHPNQTEITARCLFEGN